VNRAVGHDRLRVSLMMVLTFVTGVLDAVGYLALDKVFTGNMTGNIVILGMALAGGDDLPVLGPLLALLSFTLGAFVAGLVLRGSGAAWGPRHSALLLGGAGLAVAVGVWFIAIGGHPGLTAVTIAAPVIALQMGVQAMVARHLAVRDMTTVVVTSTLTSLAGESFVGGGKGTVWNRRFAAIAVILIGAALGTLALRLHVSVPIIAAAALTIGVVLVGHRRWSDPA
jgi:uncharacterized membrane protein YoaK (UPF0700 family)